jgi:hypothetical protein
VLLVVVLLTGCGSSDKTSRTTTSEQGLVVIGSGLRGPAGLHAAIYASGLKLMSAFAFDADGRLWITTSGADTHATDGLYVVSRAGARPVRITARFRGPLGLVWIRGSLYVSSLGRVEVLSGLTGNHFAARKTILVGPPGGGENNNLVESPAGKLVMGVSASCDHCVPVSKWSGSIVEFDTSGRGLRLVARRLRAPFGLAFYPGTNHLLATLNQRDDLGTKTPGDWLAIVRDGDDFGFPACYGQSQPGAAASRPRSRCSTRTLPQAVLRSCGASSGRRSVRLPWSRNGRWARFCVYRSRLAASAQQAGRCRS